MAPKAGGLLKGLSVTFKEFTKTVVKGPATVQYPHVKETPPIRARGVIALKEENCTVCMLCARSCPTGASTSRATRRRRRRGAPVASPAR